ncbi:MULTISPECIES: DUF1150 family protein [Komagataeibacter]|uniref:DUF1150 family protein n=2 Tax=Komagataeibacter TaxID=1434011 RepID=A0A318RAV4_9PROT|nr:MULTISPECIES: DUF1150 family protein [Komagataeibacter]GBR36952.1 hypothetical protein AA11826_1601 [Komagataeibacter oboediens DSM 11826]MBL7233686.1 DUF1150 family protein [Komagataeibacter oboediens]MBT0673924.1 DUF1150 family protein [Komagataeibacter oboediens]MBT0677353.1 DUF1150 family protein [Komagataeibacter oboediens]MBV0888416.1 DUF1150 domain-containing protein [Komagataeibacter oboediens]
MRVTTQNGRVLLQNDAVNAAPVISTSELRGLGMESVAYIREVEVEGEDAFAIHAADGTPMAVTEDRETAINAILQHEMMPVPLH